MQPSLHRILGQISACDACTKSVTHSHDKKAFSLLFYRREPEPDQLSPEGQGKKLHDKSWAVDRLAGKASVICTIGDYGGG